MDKLTVLGTMPTLIADLTCAANGSYTENYIRALCERAATELQSLSQEAVRDEADVGLFAAGRTLGFTMGLEEAAKVCEKRAQALSEDPNNGYVENDTNAFIWTNLEAGYVAEELDEAATAIRALKREPNAVGQAGQRNDSAPSQEGHAAGPAPAAPDVASMVKRLNDISEGREGRIAHIFKDCREAAALFAKLGQSHHFTVDLKQFLAPANRMSIAELKAIYGRGGTEFWFVKDPSDKETGRHYFHDSEIVDLKFTSEFYVDLPARM